MIRLREGKNYAWLVAAMGGVAAAATISSLLLTHNPSYGSVALPLFGFYLCLIQWRSGLALNSWWMAEYPRGTALYRSMLLMSALTTLVFCAFAGFAIYTAWGIDYIR